VNRVISLDLLRGLAAFLVAITHFFTYHAMQPAIFETVSVLGVELFFVLSGFVLAGQILYCLESGNLKTLKIFLIRRWMRTVPAYLVALLAVSLLFHKAFSEDFFKYALYVQNLFYNSLSDDYYPVAWSLSIEEWFYVLFPLFLILFVRYTTFLTKQNIWMAVAAFLAIVFCIRVLFGNLDDWGLQVRRCVVFRIDSIAFGFLLFLIRDRLPWPASGPVPRFAVLGLVAAIAFAVTYAIGIGDDRTMEYVFPYTAALLGMTAIWSVLSLERLLVRSPILKEVCLFAGRISYSVYLFHLLLLLTIGSSQLSWAFQLLLYALSMVLFSAVFFRFFESPILAGRPNYPAIAGDAHALSPIRTAYR
jgi:peptidoglycan/LPS O-acetylase OafA/YrhL